MTEDKYAKAHARQERVDATHLPEHVLNRLATHAQMIRDEVPLDDPERMALWRELHEIVPRSVNSDTGEMVERTFRLEGAEYPGIAALRENLRRLRDG